MVTIPAGPARRFRILLRKCRTNQPSGPDPRVLVQVIDGQLHLQTRLERVGLGLTIPTEGDALDPMLVTLANLDSAHGPMPCAGSIDPLRVPENLKAMPDDFLEALHEAWKTSAREASKYAMTCVQLRGKRGEVIATDGKQALIQNGFKFPFQDDVLVPAIQLFGTRDLFLQEEVTLGQVDGYLVVRAGPWTVWLQIDTEARFPSAADAIPRGPAPTVLDIPAMDALRLADALAALPCEDRQSRAVLFVLEERPTIWACSDTLTTPIELSVNDLRISGPHRRVAAHAGNFERALNFRLRQFQFVHEDRPWVAADSRRTYFATAIDHTSFPLLVAPQPPTNQEEPLTALPPGRVPIELEPLVTDPLGEAENLRTLFGEGHARLTKLIAFLKVLRSAPQIVNAAISPVRPLSLE
ncbi:MAG: hypothetical protein EXS09_20390 [Gemmataceae bacterium]|nr:hypothetical protein [Gemmataceae bacterium]